MQVSIVGVFETLIRVQYTQENIFHTSKVQFLHNFFINSSYVINPDKQLFIIFFVI